MVEQPSLERIIEDFIDDTAVKIKRAGQGIGDGFHANGLRSLFHNVYTRIDDDQRCVQFAREMSAWAREYSRGIPSVTSGRERSGNVKYIIPAAFILFGSCTGMSAFSFLASGESGYAGLFGLGLSGLLLGMGVRGIRRLREEGRQDAINTTFGIKPYEKYAGDIKDAPVEAVREALLAKKEHAYARLDLVPQIPTS